MKTCTKCLISKDESEFYLNKVRNKLVAACKTCDKAIKTKRYQKNWSRYRESSNAFLRTARGRFRRSKDDSKSRGISFTISLDDFEKLISQSCFYCENELGKRTEYGCGLDRLDSSIGYESSNVVPCCNFCNVIKGYLLTSEEMKKVAHLLITERNGKDPVDSILEKKKLTQSRRPD